MSESTTRKEARDDAAYAAAPSDAVFDRVAFEDGGVDLGGDEAARGRGLVRRQSRDRVSVVAALPAGWLGGPAGSPVDSSVPSSPPVGRRRAGDCGAAAADERRP